MSIYKLILALFATFALTACDDWWEGISKSGGDTEKPATTQTVSLPTATTSNTSSQSTASTESEPASTASASTATTAATETTDSKTEPAPDLPATTVAASNASTSTVSKTTADKCVPGRFEFRTDSDGKKHFDAQFLAGGRIRYNLQNGPSGTWSLSGKNMTIVGPFAPGRKNASLNMTVTKTASDCKVIQMKGRSLGGSALTLSRM